MANKNYALTSKNEEFVTTRRMAYSINEAAVLLGVSPNHLRNEQMRGKLRFVRSGKRLLIMDEDLRGYLEAQAVETAAA